MPKGRRRGAGSSMVELAKRLEHSKARIMELRQELDRESQAASQCLAELQRQAAGFNGTGSITARAGAAPRGRAATGGTGRRGSGQREAIVAFVKGKPQNAEAIAVHLGKSNKLNALRQTLMQMCKGGRLVSYKQDNGSFRAPKKGERGGYYGVP